MSNKGKKYIGLKKISDNSVIKLTSFSGNKITFLSPGTKPVIGYVTEYEFKEETLNFHLNFKNDYNETIYLTGLVKVSLAGGTTYYSVYASNYKESIEAYANDELNTNSEDFFFRNKLNVLSNLSDKQWWNINNPILDYENFENERIKNNKISISNEFDMPEREKAYKKGPIIEEVENHLKESLNKCSYDELISLHNEDESLINIYKILKRDLLKMGIQLNALELKTAKKVVSGSDSITNPLPITLKDIHGQKYGYGLTESTNEEKVLKKEYKEPRKTSVVKIDNNIDNNKADDLFNRIVEDDFVVDYQKLEQDNKTSEQIIKDNMKALGKSLDDYNKTNHNDDDNKVVNYDEKMEEVPVDGMEYNKKQLNEMLEKISADKEEDKTADIKEENNIIEPIPVKESINEEKTETAEEVVETSTEEEKVETENSEELAEAEKTQEDVVIENTPIVHDGFISEEIITDEQIVNEMIDTEEITDEELESNDNAEEIFREKAVKQLFTDNKKVYTKNHYREIFAAANKIKGKLIQENNELNRENDELVNIICTPKFKTINDLQKQINKQENTILSLKDEKEELIGKNKKLRKTNKVLNKENDDLCDSLINYAQDNISLNKTIEDQNDEISELNELVDEYENKTNNTKEKNDYNKGKIRELEKAIKEQDEKINTLTSERDEYKEKYKKLNNNKTVNNDNEEIINKDKEIDRLKDVILDKEDLLKNESASYKKLTEDYNELALKLEDKDREFNRYKMVNEETIKNNKIQLKEKEDTIKSNMNTIDNLSNQILSLKKENDDKDNIIAKLEAEIKALKNQKEESNNHKINNFKLINININRIVLVEIDGKTKKYSISINGDLAYDDNYDQEVIINKIINKKIKDTVRSNYSSLKNLKILDYNFDYNKSTLLNGSATIVNNSRVK